MQCPSCQHENREGAKFCEECGIKFILTCPNCKHEVRPQANFCDECGTSVTAQTPASSPASPMRRQPDPESRFHALLPVVIMLLQREGRITYRRLKYIFGIDDTLLEDIREELALSGLAIDEDSKVLVRTGESQPNAQPVAAVSNQPLSADASSVVVPLAPFQPSPITKTSASSDSSVVHAEAGTSTLHDEPTVPPEPTRLASEAERRQLTVMFCDLADSTKLSQKLDPEDLRDVIRAYQATAAEVINQYGGHMAQYLGDGLLIYFGWPQAHENDAQRAAYAGLGIVDAITSTLNPRLAADKGVQLTVRLGVHTGPVVVGEMGSGEQHENLATGETVNIAARLEGLAAPNTVVISAVTERLVHRAFALEDLGPQVLKGVVEPMGVFRVLRPLDSELDENEHIPDGGVFLVGRNEEVGLLLRRWEQAKEGLGQVVLISGEAGIGKSSLVATVRHHVRQEGYTCVTFRCSPYHTNSALYPVIEHVLRVLRFQPGDTPESRLDKLEYVLSDYSRPLDEVVPLYAALLSLPLPEGRYVAPNLSPQQQRQQTQDALVGWLLERAERQPTLAMWEDLHWADPSTLEFLSLVIDQTPTVPMLHVLTFRPGFEPPWPTRSHMTPMTLNRLERPQVEALITHMASDRELPTEVVEHIVTKTDGVPLYVGELTKMLLASDLLREEAYHYVLTGPLATVTIPDTLQDSLMARLDQMNTAKEVAQLGAVLGRKFTYEMLQAIAPQDEETLQGGLGQLVASELLYQRGRPPQARYIFRHALIQDAAYVSLLRSTRQRVHRQIAELLAARSLDIVDIQPEFVAHHYTEADCHEQATDYWQQAGRRANARSAYREAVACYEQALDAMRHLPESREMMEQAINLHLDLRNALLPLSEHQRIFDALCEAERLCEALGNQPQLGRVFSYITRYFFGMGDHRRAIEFGQRALDIATDLGDFSLQVVANFYMGVAHHHLGDYRPASDFFGRIMLPPEDERSRKRFGLPYLPAVFARCFLVRCLAELGEFADGKTRAEESVRIAEEVEQPWDVVVAYFGVGVLHLRQGEYHAAISALERALRLCQSADISEWLGSTAAYLVSAYALLGQIPEEPLAILERETERLISIERTGRISILLGGLSQAYLLAGRESDATDCALRALDYARTQKEQGHETWALQLLGEIAMSRDPMEIEQAKSHYQQALTLANELAMRPLQAHGHRGLGILYRQTGQPEQARAELSTAIDMYRDMGMTFWLPETEDTLSELEGKA